MPTHTNAQKNIHEIERAPIVVIMGHVDHGKSTLLDYIRESNIVATEAGGITQHTSAYEVSHKDERGGEKRITFLDTPGHESFSLMRMRGAQVADIAILVVAADDGVKAQTLEALSAIKEKNIPYIVAINKIDKPNANPEKTKQELAEHGIYLEGYGGDVPLVELSAKTGEGIPELLDMILLVAELQELKGDTQAPASGIIIESHRDQKRGNSAIIVLKNGMLRKGEFGISGESFTPIRRIENFLGEQVDKAVFSSPVGIIGFSSIPSVGDTFTAFKTKKELDAYKKNLPQEEKTSKAPAPQGSKSEAFQEQEEERAVLSLIVKADTQGTLEALVMEIQRINVERVDIQIIHKGVGGISEFDIKRAVGNFRAYVIGFNTSVEESARRLAEQLHVPIQTFNIIYKLSEWLTEECQRQKPRIKVEEATGKAKIIRIFSVAKSKQVVGGKVVEGNLIEGKTVKIIRREHGIGTGKIIELQSQKTRTKEVPEGKEFGAMIDSKIEIAPNDILEAFTIVEQ